MADTNTVYISLITGFTPSKDFPDVAKKPAAGLQAIGYNALPASNEVITVYHSGDNPPYQYAATVKYSNHIAVIFFYGFSDVKYFLTEYAPLAPVIEAALNL